jgi:hypothetical protein
VSITPGIATLDELKAYLNKTRSTDDIALQAMLDGVSTRVETYTGRRFRPDPPLADDGTDSLPDVTRTVPIPQRHLREWGWGGLSPWARPWTPLLRPRTLDIPDARVITGIAGNSAVTFQGFQGLGEPPYRRVELFEVSFVPQYPITSTPAITITGRFGWWPPPADLKDAVLFMAARRWKERDAEYGDVVQYAEGMTVSYFRQFPPTVQATLEQYIRKVRLT